MYQVPNSLWSMFSPMDSMMSLFMNHCFDMCKIYSTITLALGEILRQ
jgi:hypothetical protein